MTPEPWVFVLLGLAAFRCWWLLARDTILDKPRAWFVARTGRDLPVEDWLGCPFCSGAWITLAWWGAWWAWPHAVTVAAVPFALSAVVGVGGALVTNALDE